MKWNQMKWSYEFYVLTRFTGAIIHEDALAYDDSTADIFSEKYHFWQQKNILMKYAHSRALVNEITFHLLDLFHLLKKIINVMSIFLC